MTANRAVKDKILQVMSTLPDVYMVEYACHTLFCLSMKKIMYNMASATVHPCRTRIWAFLMTHILLCTDIMITRRMAVSVCCSLNLLVPFVRCVLVSDH
jgi:hypothetical protein